MVHKDKNTIKNTKSQLKKTVRTKLTKLKLYIYIYIETQQNGTIFS